MRKKHMGKLTAVCLCIALLLSGCQIGNKDIVVSTSVNNRQVFKIGSGSCSLKEAKVYLVNYQNIYGSAYGIDLWQHDFGDDSLEEYVKNITIEELTQVVCMDLLAESQGMELTETEKSNVEQAAEEYYASLTSAELEYMGVSENDICEYYEHYALAQKLYHSLTNAVNEEVSDDEARVMEIMQIYVTDSAKASEVTEKLGAGEDFASVANNYNELGSIQVMVSRNDLPEEVEKIAFQLDDGEVSEKIEVDNGYYFIRCIDKYNEELTEANKVNILEKREKDAFDGVYNEFVEAQSSYINESLWENLELDTQTDMKTDSFFEVFDTYCSGI